MYTEPLHSSLMSKQTIFYSDDLILILEGEKILQ